MNTTHPTMTASASLLRDAIDQACGCIAPTWPLDRMIAVNPYWERIHEPFEQVASSLAQYAGSPITMPMAYYRERWESGVIRIEHVRQAMSEKSLNLTSDAVIASLEQDYPAPIPAPLLSDTFDKQRDLIHEPAWCDTITHQIAQFCAAYFDQEQADWHPQREQTLYESWRSSLSQDHSVALLMKAPDIPKKAKKLASTAFAQIEQALQQLHIPETVWADYLQTVILRVSGWAAWCAYLRWQARLRGESDHALEELLAIRLSWECLVDSGNRQVGSTWERWFDAWNEHTSVPQSHNQQLLLLWQRAHEISYQWQLCDQLLAQSPVIEPEKPHVQAVFCIDVRSEIFRRHLENQSDLIQTFGFAGFFGLPISYTPIGTQAVRPQLPGLLAPVINISETTGNTVQDQALIKSRQQALHTLFSWRPFKTLPASAFTLVETLGIGYAFKLIRRSQPNTEKRLDRDAEALGTDAGLDLRPVLLQDTAGGLQGQVDIAQQVLTGMNLQEGIAPLVLLIGHGSQNQNNPQRASLDCGACCGQTGEVNSRTLAGLLNDAQVRSELHKRAIVIPDSTWFIAGLHNTTTEEVQLFDTQIIPESHAEALQKLKRQLVQAGIDARSERADSLGLQALAHDYPALLQAFKQRANDWAQTRPEWGLAKNAAFIIASRQRTRGVNLAGRSFLHEYDFLRDPQGQLLEQIMTAPMIVTHWINMQYFASSVDNKRFGSGNKTLHNVVGGRLGLFEGNGGDLRIGLAMQSVHNGQQWMHEPVRLTVVIDAPQETINRVLDKHISVKQLVHNQWLYLARFAGDSMEFYHQGRWEAWCQHL